jgi:hypothetical protein
LANVTNPDQDIPVLRGDSATVTFVLSRPNAQGQIEDFPIDHTTHEMWFTVKADTGVPDTQAEIRKRLSVGEMTVRPAPDDDIVDVVIAAGETAVMPPGDYFYDAQVKVLASGEVKTVALGRFTVLPDVTRST